MIDEAHQLTKDAFNALLKTLEEPPEYLKFVLATTDPEKMLPTVLSRCLQFNLRPMAPETVREHLQQVLAAEGVPSDDGSLRLLARAARGSMRDGLSLTDQAIAYGGGQLAEGGGARHARQRRPRPCACAGRGAGAARRRRRAGGRGRPARPGPVGRRHAGGDGRAAAADGGGAGRARRAGRAGPGTGRRAARWPALLAADETQLLYSMVLHGRGELQPDERRIRRADDGAAALPGFPGRRRAARRRHAPRPTSSAEPCARRGAGARRCRCARAGAARADTAGRRRPRRRPPVRERRAAPAALAAPHRRGPLRLRRRPWPTVPTALGDRWADLVQRLCEQGASAALVRELAHAGRACARRRAAPRRRAGTCGRTRDAARTGACATSWLPRWPPSWASPCVLELEAGVPDDSPARREAAERQRRQAAAEETIRNDPVVRELMTQFKTRAHRARLDQTRLN